MLDITRLLIQIGIVLLTARVVGWTFRKVHQPQVVGEMAAGLLLGPSFFGMLAPGAYGALFPKESFALLGTLSQVGLILYMFLVGATLDVKRLKERPHAAIVTSHVSIIVPFVMGLLLAVYLYPRLSSGEVPFSHFSLFLGISMSITAFPVLARILTDRKMANSGVGAVAITCAAVDDVTAWCLLAALILFVRASAAALPLWATLGGSALFVGVMLLAVRPAAAALLARYRPRGAALTKDVLAAILLGVFASAWVTEFLGIHALFGAFLMGSVLPKEDGLAAALAEKLEDVTVIVLLPLFFALTGLKTSLPSLGGGDFWFYGAVILAVAVVGKLGGAAVASHVTGLSWREAGAVGILMNTRGLMELVVLNIGLDLGVVSPPLFAMLVIMALATTCMTTPLLDWFYLGKRAREDVVAGRRATSSSAGYW